MENVYFVLQQISIQLKTGLCSQLRTLSVESLYYALASFYSLLIVRRIEFCAVFDPHQLP